MLERNVIQSSGFSNRGPVGGRTGFQLRLRQPNYRGMRLSLVEGIDVTVGGVNFPASRNVVVLRGIEYSRNALDSLEETRWHVGEAVDVLVDLAGGLEPGVHRVETIVWMRHPYFPPQFRPVPMRDSQHVTIIV